MKPFYKCPRFHTCSAPKCPLDPDYHERVKASGEESCKLAKLIRLRIAKEFSDTKLPYEGYTAAEWRGLKSFQSGINQKVA